MESNVQSLRRFRRPLHAIFLVTLFYLIAPANAAVTTNGIVTTVTTGPDWKTTSPLPPVGWNTNLNFDDSAWIAPVTGSTSKVIWYGSIQDINSPSQAWFRYTFFLSTPLAAAAASLSFDDQGEAYVNGTEIESHDTGSAGTFDVTLDPSLFVVGENLIAVHGMNTIAPFNSINETYTLTAVPEPISGLLFAGTSAFLFFRRRVRFI